MAKTKISEYSTTNSSNTDINSINIDEGCAPSGINNAIREIMVHLRNFQTNASGDGATLASLVVQGTGSFTGSVTMSAGATLSGTNTLSGSNIMSGNINSSGTNTFSGSQVITGNINSSGSANTFSGNVLHSGTNTFSGATVISGNATLSGTTNTISGSAIISGNINSSGTNTFSGSQVISGNINSSGTNTFSGNTTFGSGNLKLSGSSSGVATLVPPAVAGTNTYTLPPDTATLGYRNVPISGSAKTTSYTLATTDVGEYIEVGSGGSITIPNSTFSTGDIISIFNNTSGNITITCSITTAYIAGTDVDKNSMTLGARGLATILFISGTVCVVTGNVS